MHEMKESDLHVVHIMSRLDRQRGGNGCHHDHHRAVSLDCFLPDHLYWSSVACWWKT